MIMLGRGKLCFRSSTYLACFLSYLPVRKRSLYLIRALQAQRLSIFLEKEEEEMMFIVCSILFVVIVCTFSLVRLSGQISQEEYQHTFLK